MGVLQTQPLSADRPRQRKPAPLPVENPASLKLRIEQLEQRVSALEDALKQSQQQWHAVVIGAHNAAVRALGDARKAPGEYATHQSNGVVEVASTPDAPFDFCSFVQRQSEFSARAFGPGPSTSRIIDHIKKELIEVAAAPSDLEEQVDVITLAIDLAWRAGHSPGAIAAMLEMKLAKNLNRKWPDWRTADPNKAVEHDRSAD